MADITPPRLTLARRGALVRPTLAELLAIGGGKLPPLAGAGGSWSIFIPKGIATNGGPNVSNQLAITAPQIDLLANTTPPTKLETWKITAIYLPVIMTMNLTGLTEPELTAAVPVFSSTLSLLYGGDRVWSQTLAALPMELVGGFTNAWSNSTAFGDSIINPISVNTGKSLKLLWEVFYSAKLKEGSAAKISGSISLGQTEGTVQYSSETLTGHRTL